MNKAKQLLSRSITKRIIARYKVLNRPLVKSDFKRSNITLELDSMAAAGLATRIERSLKKYAYEIDLLKIKSLENEA